MRKNLFLSTLLEEAAAKAGCKTVYTEMEHAGGLAIIKGEKRLIINKRLSVPEKINIISENIRKLDFSNIFLPPAIRDIIEEAE